MTSIYLQAPVREVTTTVRMMAIACGMQLVQFVFVSQGHMDNGAQKVGTSLMKRFLNSYVENKHVHVSTNKSYNTFYD